MYISIFFFFSSRRRHTRCSRDWSSDVCSSDLKAQVRLLAACDLRLVARLHWQLEPFRPFRERSVVHAHPRVAEQVVQREIHVARLEAAVTVGDDRLLGSDPLRRVARAQLVAPRSE